MGSRRGSTKSLIRPAIVLLYLLVGSARYVMAQPYNVVLIYVDDLGYGDLACYGHPIIETPQLDRLAAEGIRFTQYYAPSALCSPSRAALLTGRHPYRTGIQSWIPDGSGLFLSAKERTLASLLQKAGFQTALIGKWHLNSDLSSKEETQPGDHGFDYSYGHNAFQIPTNYRPTNIYKNGELEAPLDGYTAQIYVDEAVRWLRVRDTSKPFFLFLSMAEPHTTIENPAEFNARYQEHTRGEIIPIPSGANEIPYHLLTPRGPGEYFANISYLDHELGRVLDYLETHDLNDKTIVLFASDNGPVTQAWRAWWEVNAYGNTAGLRGRKHLLYEGGIRVPAIIKHPELPGGTTFGDAVSGIDWFPTILSWNGMQPPADRPYDGLDISAFLEGQGSIPQRDLIWSLPTDNGLDHAIRQGDFKLLLDHNQRGQELYDLRTDPLELVNLIQKRADQAQLLEQRFQEKYRKVLLDPVLVQQ